MLTHQRVRRIVEETRQGPGEALVRTPCVVIHTEESQVPRFVERVKTLSVEGCDVTVDAVATPLIYIHAHPIAASTRSLQDINAVLREQAEKTFGCGRIAAHRVYRLDWSCSDPQWIPYAQALREVSSASFSLRVVAYPRQLQAKIMDLLVANGIATHPTSFTHELFVTTQPSVSSLFYFGVTPRQEQTVLDVLDQTTSTPATRAEAPCRAFFKLEESLLHHVPLTAGQHVLDVGASPGGWTDCLILHGARVVAVDPGELIIPLASRPVIHIQSLLEDAFDQLASMEKFAMAVCDINVRVPNMATLMLRVAPLLEPRARIIFTLKLGKKPTPQAAENAFTEAQHILSPAFQDFRLVWLHANTQNERTLFGIKRG